MTQLRFLEAHTETHYKDMSLLHALGWRAAYHGLIPKDYLDREILDDRWVPFFHDNCGTGKLQGLILYNGEHPLCCGVYMALCGRSFSPKAYPVWPSGEN